MNRLLVLVLVLALLPMAAAPGQSESAGAGQPDPAAVVTRLAGPDRAATAARLAQDGWQQAGTVVLVDGGRWTDSLVGAHLAARIDAPVLVSGAQMPEVTRQTIEDLGVERLLVIGDADDGDIDGGDADGVVVERIGGATPEDLAVAALDIGPAPPDRPLVVTSLATFPDALSAGNLAPAGLLLTDPGTLSPATADAIARLAPDRVVVMGGPAAVADGVVGQIADLGPDVGRVAGGSRHDTAVQAAAHRPGGTVAVASGDVFADAIALVPWAARRQAAILLTPHPAMTATSLDHVVAAGHDGAVVAGGTAAVGNHVDAQLSAAITGTPLPDVVRAVRELTAEERERMTGTTWEEGCPVGLDALRAIELSHFDLGGNVRDDGLLVVHADVAEDVAQVVVALFDARFGLHRVQPAHTAGGDDDLLMATNTTSAFNCRTVAGTSRWSTHADGTAIDINPVQNPWVRGDAVEPPAGRAYLDRTDVRPGMVVRPGPVVRAFEAIGWGWGADFTTSDDLQHFSLSGR